MQNWLEETKAKLNAVPRWVSLTQIADEAELQISWLSAFAAGKIDEPGIGKVQKLYDYLCLSAQFKRPERLLFSNIIEMNSSSRHDQLHGVYVVWENDTCLYVGVSNDIIRRVKEHAYNGKLQNHKPTHIDIIYTEDDEAADVYKLPRVRHKLEAIKIKTLQPILNIAGK